MKGSLIESVTVKKRVVKDGEFIGYEDMKVVAVEVSTNYADSEKVLHIIVEEIPKMHQKLI
jgi:hypothetical protein